MGRQPIEDVIQNPIRFDQRLAIVEAQYLKAQLIHLGSAMRVAAHRSLIEMLPTIEFDNEPTFDASEIGEVPADRMLPAELVSTQLTGAKSLPDRAFSVGRSMAKFASPHPNPLPRAGEGTGWVVLKRHGLRFRSLGLN
jgi:hypothetical protein